MWEHLSFARSALDDLERGAIAAGVREGRLVRVIRGCFVAHEVWSMWFPEQRLLARTLAVAAVNARCAPLFSHQSAAALWGIPLYGLRDLRVHTLTPTARPGRSSATVARHLGEWCSSDETQIFGIRVTSLTRTILDLARCASPEMAISAADSGMRLLFGAQREGVSDPAHEWRAEQLALLDRFPGHRGVRKARHLLKFADPRADSPVESVSRLCLERLDIDVDIQVRVDGVGGARYWVDFEFLGQGIFGEVDGQAKYLDAELRGGRSAEAVVVLEKEREDQIRGITGNSMVRWPPKALTSVRTLGERLHSFGVEVPNLGRAPSRRPAQHERFH
ncbi:hypothetical protein ACFWHR_06010 [Leucobacter sp. NPDC058333]|uniref:hypothetical protein n=1 Tax=Leucobacter sp. NPDC058333 TaxID=3346450 RepID=UPI0036601ABC